MGFVFVIVIIISVMININIIMITIIIIIIMIIVIIDIVKINQIGNKYTSWVKVLPLLFSAAQDEANRAASADGLKPSLKAASLTEGGF